MTLSPVENPEFATRKISQITNGNPLSDHVSKQLVTALSRRNLNAAEIEKIWALAAKARSIFQLCIMSKLSELGPDALSEMHQTLMVPYIPEFSELEISRKDYDWMKSEVRRCMKSASQTASV